MRQRLTTNHTPKRLSEGLGFDSGPFAAVAHFRKAGCRKSGFNRLESKKAHLKGWAFLFVGLGIVWGLLGFFLSVSACFAANEVVFAAYNLENYAVQASAHTHAKSERAKEAVARVIAEVRPDILGVCEMGASEAVEDLRERLRVRGIEFTEVEMVLGPDPDRHLVLLSRYPLVSRQSRVRVPYELNGEPQLVRRGILDVTARLPGGETLRMVGVHFKSKLAIPEGEALVRRMEAQLLRRHVEAILAGESGSKLLVYGDMNDTKEQPGIREILGEKSGPDSLVDLVAEDSMGDRWTHYWRAADMYARIDYLMVSRGLWPGVVRGSAQVSRSPSWKEASDHRLLSVRIDPSKK